MLKAFNPEIRAVVAEGVNRMRLTVQAVPRLEAPSEVSANERVYQRYDEGRGILYLSTTEPDAAQAGLWYQSGDRPARNMPGVAQCTIALPFGTELAGLAVMDAADTSVLVKGGIGMGRLAVTREVTAEEAAKEQNVLNSLHLQAAWGGIVRVGRMRAHTLGTSSLHLKGVEFEQGQTTTLPSRVVWHDNSSIDTNALGGARGRVYMLQESADKCTTECMTVIAGAQMLAEEIMNLLPVE